MLGPPGTTISPLMLTSLVSAPSDSSTPYSPGLSLTPILGKESKVEAYVPRAISPCAALAEAASGASFNICSAVQCKAQPGEIRMTSTISMQLRGTSVKVLTEIRLWTQL